jgi:hypothetical protein
MITLSELSNCNLGKLRNYLSNRLDLEIGRKVGSSKILLTQAKLAFVVKESKGRGLLSSGMMGICDCKVHMLIEEDYDYTGNQDPSGMAG